MITVIPMVPTPAPSDGLYMSKYSPYGVEEPMPKIQDNRILEEDTDGMYYSGAGLDEYPSLSQQNPDAVFRLGLESTK